MHVCACERVMNRARAVLAVCLCACACLCAVCPPCPPPPARCELKEEGADSTCLYEVDGIDENLVIVPTRQSFGLICPENVTLESESLPKFPTQIEVAKVTLRDCALPAGPYAHALAQINVTVRDALQLASVYAGSLRPDHFRDLDTLLELYLSNRDEDIYRNRYLVVNKTSLTVFDSLKSLTKLKLKGVHLPFPSLKNLTRLNTLDLQKCSITKNIKSRKNVEGASKCSFPSLRTLRLLSTVGSRVPPPLAACLLSHVTISGAGPRLLSVPHIPTAETLYLGRETYFQKLNNCSYLKSLTIENNAINVLPERLVEECAELRSLTLVVSNLTRVSPELLQGAVKLQELTLTRSRLDALPRGLLASSRRTLQGLDLSYNQLTTLDEGMFSALTSLVWLNLSHNQLTGESLSALANLPLTTLQLDDNPLGDLCPTGDFIYTENVWSPLHSLSQLQSLSLAGTGARRLCPDWYQQRHLTSLTNLNLEYNNIDTLLWTDLTQWNRNVLVRLENNNFTGIQFTYQDYVSAHINTNAIKVRFIIDLNPMKCDCSMYWFARAIREEKVPALFETIYCESPAYSIPLPLALMNLTDMVCEWHIGKATCTRRPKDNDGTSINCSNRGLITLPDVSTLQDYYKDIELNVRNNTIQSLPDELPARLRMIDLRNNTLRDLNTSLLADERRSVRLAHNPLHCGCDQPLLDVFRRYQDQIKDKEPVTCSDGRLVQTVLKKCGGRGGARDGVWDRTHAPVWVAAGGALLLALLVGAGGARGWWRGAGGVRARGWLLARGCCLRCVLPTDTEHFKYDAFLSYAQDDWDVAEELRRGLEGGEGGAAPLRVCVHHRDWQPGEWIPKQITRSVNESRRTIILLSENFAKSSWARAEFREAYARALRDNAVRLIVVVLGSGPPADLDPDIRHYVANNTYLRWGERAFWEKLRLAIPTCAPSSPHMQPSRASRAKKKVPPGAPRAPDPPVPVHPAPPQPPTPVVKFSQFDYPAPVKPIKSVSPPCA